MNSLEKFKKDNRTILTTDSSCIEYAFMEGGNILIKANSLPTDDIFIKGINNDIAILDAHIIIQGGAAANNTVYVNGLIQIPIVTDDTFARASVYGEDLIIVNKANPLSISGTTEGVSDTYFIVMRYMAL